MSRATATGRSIATGRNRATGRVIASSRGYPAVTNGLLTGLLAYWKLDEASGNRADSSGRGNTLVQSNNPLSGTGIINSGAQFVAASGQFLSCDSADMVIPAGDWGISGWVKFTDKASTYVILSVTNAANGDIGIGYNKTAGDLPNSPGASDKFGIFSESMGSYPAAISAAAWYHFVVTRSGANVLFYLNGVLQSTVAADVPDGFSILNLGQHGDFGFNLNGLIDEVGKWNKALSATDVSNLYNSGAGLSYNSFSS